jgi:hypothetical protein
LFHQTAKNYAMKISTLLLFLFISVTAFSQKKIDHLTFDDCQNFEVFQKIGNNTHLMKYTAADGSLLTIGDSLVIGYPSGSTTNTSGVGAGESNVGIGTATSKTQNSFSNIIMGRPGGVGNLLAAGDNLGPNNAPSKMQGEIVIISEMRVIHKGSRKKPLRVLMLLGEPNGRAFGINKYMSVTDYEKAVIAGEIKSLNAPMTREEAIAKLKETKELMELGIIEETEYNKLKKELAPIIMRN